MTSSASCRSEVSSPRMPTQLPPHALPGPEAHFLAPRYNPEVTAPAGPLVNF